MSSSDSSANNIALAAAVLAAAAFVISVAQTVLQYASSSTSRSKCTFTAIDASSKQVKLRWSWHLWRLKVEYPVLDFSYRKIVDMAMKSSQQAIDAHHSPMELIRYDHNWQWFAIEEKDDIKHDIVADSFTKLMNEYGTESVSTQELSWREYFTYRWWKFRNPSQTVIRPRASWAQILLAFGIRDTHDLTYKHADADLIPSNYDAPVQRVRLYDLGFLALMLGFTTVKINVRERTFEASGPFATITTLTLPDTGKVLRFEGDLFAIYDSITMEYITNLYNVSDIVWGKVSFGPWFIMDSYYWPLQLWKKATARDWDTKKYESEFDDMIYESSTREGFSKGQIGLEAILFKELCKEDSEREHFRGRKHSHGEAKSRPQSQVLRRATGLSTTGHLLHHDDYDDWENFEYVCAQWQGVTGQKVPTILAAAALAVLPSAIVGFPSRILIHPFLPWIKRRARNLKLRQLEHIKICHELTHSIRMGSLKFLRKTGKVWASYGLIGLSEEDNKSGWIYKDILKIYDHCELNVRNKIIVKDEDGKPTGDVNAVLFPDMLMLLDHYNPAEWAEVIENKVITISQDQFRPAIMLWAQILLIDLSIHLLVRGIPNTILEEPPTKVEERDEEVEEDEEDKDTFPASEFELWGKETVAVCSAVIESWSQEEAESEGMEVIIEEPPLSAERPSGHEPVPGTQEQSRTSPNSSASESNQPTKEPSPSSLSTGENKPNEPIFDSASWSTVQTDPPAPDSPEFGPFETETADDDLDPSSSKPKKESPEQDNNEPPLDEGAQPYIDWDLHSCLMKQKNLKFGDRGRRQRREKIKQLADLLELRSLIVIAFYMLNPDSSDVFMAYQSEVEMPMM